MSAQTPGTARRCKLSEFILVVSSCLNVFEPTVSTVAGLASVRQGYPIIVQVLDAGNLFWARGSFEPGFELVRPSRGCSGSTPVHNKVTRRVRGDRPEA